VANWLFAQTTHVAVSKSKFACRVASGVQFYISSFIKIGPVVLPLWVVENRPSLLLWPLAYTTACTTVQAVMWKLLVVGRHTSVLLYPAHYGSNVSRNLIFNLIILCIFRPVRSVSVILHIIALAVFAYSVCFKLLHSC